MTLPATSLTSWPRSPALTGIFAIQHFTKDIDETRRVVQTRLARILNRVPGESD